jgi:hypothetical protein
MDASLKRDIRRTCWQGVVPVCFRLAPKDAAGSEAPLPLYLMLSRMSYFPQVYDRVKVRALPVSFFWKAAKRLSHRATFSGWFRRRWTKSGWRAATASRCGGTLQWGSCSTCSTKVCRPPFPGR